MSNLRYNIIDKYLFSSKKKLRSKEFVTFEIPNSLGIPSYFWKRDWKGREFSRDDIFDDKNSYSRDFSQRIRPPFLWSWDVYIYTVIYTGIRINVYEERALRVSYERMFVTRPYAKIPLKGMKKKEGEKVLVRRLGTVNTRFWLGLVKRFKGSQSPFIRVVLVQYFFYFDRASKWRNIDNVFPCGNEHRLITNVQQYIISYLCPSYLFWISIIREVRLFAISPLLLLLSSSPEPTLSRKHGRIFIRHCSKYQEEPSRLFLSSFLSSPRKKEGKNMVNGDLLRAGGTSTR